MTSIVWRFCTFPKLDYSNGAGISWIRDLDLERNFQLRLDKDQNSDAATPDFWALFFWKNFASKDEKLAAKHLVAYLQKISLRAAKKVHGKLSGGRLYSQLYYDRLDVIQIALEIACNVNQFYRDFKPDRPIENFSYKKMEEKIFDYIHQQPGMNRRRSDWGLLKYSSNKKMLNAIQYYANGGNESYKLAFDCFKHVYTEKVMGGQLLAPSQTQLQQMCALYAELVRVHQLAGSGVNPEIMRNMLLELIQALRKLELHSKCMDSIDEKKLSEDADSASDNDSVSDIKKSPDLPGRIETENIEFIKNILNNLLANIDTDDQKHLQMLLRDGFELEFSPIASILQVSEPTLRSRCSRLVRKLLEQVAQQLGCNADSETLNQQLSHLKKVLEQHYHDLVFELVLHQARQLDRQCLNILLHRYVRLQDNDAIAYHLEISEEEVSNELEKGKHELEGAIQNWIHTRLKFATTLPAALTDKIAEFVEDSLPAVLMIL